MDREGPKASQYRLVPISNPETVKAALAAALGIRRVVEKRREIFLVENVRIHLDEVVGLGNFLEFEAVLGARTDDAAGHAQVDQLMGTFDVDRADLLSGSYGDMSG